MDGTATKGAEVKEASDVSGVVKGAKSEAVVRHMEQEREDLHNMINEFKKDNKTRLDDGTLLKDAINDKIVHLNLMPRLWGEELAGGSEMQMSRAKTVVNEANKELRAMCKKEGFAIINRDVTHFDPAHPNIREIFNSGIETHQLFSDYQHLMEGPINDAFKKMSIEERERQMKLFDLIFAFRGKLPEEYERTPTIGENVAEFDGMAPIVGDQLTASAIDYEEAKKQYKAATQQFENSQSKKGQETDEKFEAAKRAYENAVASVGAVGNAAGGGGAMNAEKPTASKTPLDKAISESVELTEIRKRLNELQSELDSMLPMAKSGMKGGEKNEEKGDLYRRLAELAVSNYKGSLEEFTKGGGPERNERKILNDRQKLIDDYKKKATEGYDQSLMAYGSTLNAFEGHISALGEDKVGGEVPEMKNLRSMANDIGSRIKAIEEKRRNVIALSVVS